MADEQMMQEFYRIVENNEVRVGADPMRQHYIVDVGQLRGYVKPSSNMRIHTLVLDGKQFSVGWHYHDEKYFWVGPAPTAEEMMKIRLYAA